jgi:NAD(P)-dependent dehydrogenase (short-subunit alcohol dehydrogenase family)
MPIFDYSNRVVLITGIGAVGDGYGNGGAMAAAMARQGAIIFGCDINLEAANKAAEQIRNEDEVKNHPSRKEGESVVDVFQQRTVRSIRCSIMFDCVLTIDPLRM